MPARPAILPPPPLLDFVLSHARIVTNVCTLQKHEAGYTLEPRRVPDYNLIFVTRGRVTWTVEDRPFPLVPNDLILVPPGPRHFARSQTKRVTLGSLHVEVTLPGGQDVFALLAPPRVQRVPRRARLNTYLRGFMDELARPDAVASPMLPAWSRLITLELFRFDAEQGLLRPRPADPVVSEILDELHRRAARPVALAELAARAGYSPQHLNRIFRRALGVTPLQYLTRYRLYRAASLLADGRLTVRAIAGSVGFDDPYYFSRAFRQHFGRSPAQHRAAAGSDSPSPRSAAPLPRRRRRG